MDLSQLYEIFTDWPPSLFQANTLDVQVFIWICPRGLIPSGQPAGSVGIYLDMPLWSNPVPSGQPPLCISIHLHMPSWSGTFTPTCWMCRYSSGYDLVVWYLQTSMLDV